MQRMNSSLAPVIATLPFGEIRAGFMKNTRGDIFYLGTHGRETIAFPILSDGSISRHADVSALEHPSRRVNLVDPAGIKIDVGNLKWTEEKADP